MITKEKFDEFLSYDPKSGAIVWKKTCGSASKGYLAGSLFVCKHSGKKYHRITFEGKSYMAHRLAFLCMDGCVPKLSVDHIDGNGLNNEWANLRLVTTIQNNRNAKLYKCNKSGCTGVYWAKNEGKWRATISKISLGYFNNIEEAVRVRKEAEKKYGFHPNHGENRAL